MADGCMESNGGDVGHDVLIARSGFRKGFLAGSSSKWAVQMGPRTPRLRDTKTFSFPTLRSYIVDY